MKEERIQKWKLFKSLVSLRPDKYKIEYSEIFPLCFMLLEKRRSYKARIDIMIEENGPMKDRWHVIDHAGSKFIGDTVFPLFS